MKIDIMINLTLIIGIIGSLVTLYAFIMVQIEKWTAKSKLFDLFNFLGAVFLLFYALDTKSIPFILTNTVWGLFSLKDLIKATA